MKKLLLVMLVPVLVLGVMGCGKLMEGDQNPTALQGQWTSTDIELTIAGNQITMGNSAANRVAFRSSYDGPKQDVDGEIPDGTFKLELYDFDKTKDNEIGTLECTWTSGVFTVDKFVPPSDRTYYTTTILANTFAGAPISFTR